MTCDLFGCWGVCIGAVGPGNEVCDDNIDNDCDGSIDEGCYVPEPAPAAEREAPAAPRASICREQWQCSEWSECYPDGTQFRKCEDLNKCTEQYNQRIVSHIKAAEKPKEVQSCVYTPAAAPILKALKMEIPSLTVKHIPLIIAIFILIMIAFITYKKSRQKEKQKKKR